MSIFMNQRLQQFLSAENLSQSQFADTIGVARASVSHILAGRNKPGFDFIENVAKRYPSLNIDWFITGKGKMYKNASESTQGKIFEAEENVTSDDLFSAAALDFQEKNNHIIDAPVFPITESRTSSKKFQSIDNKKVIVKVTVFYSDGTYKEL